ncbi:hypothetical protein OIO90_000936 [Microbotryomycetes sp. JL221]|nr:hypothetical protein OIO90_000936 [Microbotryomycetes sp. JL221]
MAQARSVPPLPPRPPDIIVRSSSATTDELAAAQTAQPPPLVPARSTWSAQEQTPSHVGSNDISNNIHTVQQPQCSGLERVDTESLTGFAVPMSDNSFDDAHSTVDKQHDLPSYEQLRHQEPGNPRFGRWRGWIEKRARERITDEKTNSNGTLSSSKKTWDLDGTRQNSTESEAELALRRRQQNLIEKRMSRPHNVITNATSLDDQDEIESGSATDSSSTGIGSVGGHRSEELTLNLTLRPLGSRFAPGLPEKPTCAVALPLGGRPSPGLYLVDLLPTMGLSTMRTSTVATETQIYPLWSGLGVLQLDLHLEKEDAAGQPLGVVTALVQNNAAQHSEIRMWSLNSLLNLARWRVYTEGSRCLSVQLPPSSTVNSPTSPQKHSGSIAKGFVKSFFSGKGKDKATKSASMSRDQSSEYDVSRRSTSETTDELLAMPLEWFHSSLPLPLPRGHGPILFIRRTRLPCINSNVHTSTLRDERQADGWLFLLVATTRTIYVFESNSMEKRTWKLTKQLFSPSTPTDMELVRIGSNSTSQASIAPDYPSDLALVLTMSTKAVLIYLNDSSVIELDLPSNNSQNSRLRSRSTVSATSTISNKSSLSLRASTIGTNALQHVTQFVEGSKNVPVEARGMERHSIALGKKLDEGLMVEGSINNNSGGHVEERWSGCTRLSIRLPNRELIHLSLITKGQVTHLIAHQNPVANNAMSDSSMIKPLFTFNWSSTTSTISTIYPLIRRQTLQPTYEQAGFVHLLLIAVTGNGIAAQEGLLDLPGLRHQLLQQQQQQPGQNIFNLTKEPLFRRLSMFGTDLTSPEWPMKTIQSESIDVVKEMDVQDVANVDFGRQLVGLTCGGPWFVDNLQQTVKTTTDSQDINDDDDDKDEDERDCRIHERAIDYAEQSTRSGLFLSVQSLTDWNLFWLG